MICICCGVYPCPGTHSNSPVLSSTLSRSGHGRCHRSSPRGWRLIQPCTTIVKGGDCPQVWCQPPAPLHIQYHYFSDPLFTVLLHAPVKCWLSIPSIIPPFITPMQLLVISLIACPYRTIILHLLYHASIYLISFLLSNQSESRCVHSTMTYKLWIWSHYFSL